MRRLGVSLDSPGPTHILLLTLALLGLGCRMLFRADEPKPCKVTYLHDVNIFRILQYSWKGVALSFY